MFLLMGNKMGNKKYLVTVLATAALSLSTCCCAVLPPKLILPEISHTIADLEPYLERAVEKQEPPSISIAVTKDNDTVYAKSFGYRDAQRLLPATSETVYQWWSITKLFTVVAVLQLQERGLLSINDPVVKHLPSFSTGDKLDNIEQISIKQLLSHSSGLGDIGREILGWVHFDGDPHPNQTEFFNKNVDKYNKLKTTPGTKGSYSNFGFLTLAALIEAVSGNTYEDFILNNIIIPLGMTHTNFIYTKKMNKNFAVGSHPKDFISMIVPMYLDTDRAVKEKKDGTLWFNHVYSDHKGSSGLIGPSTDLLKFVSIFLREDNSLGEPILSKQSVLLMQAPVLDADKSPAPIKNLQFGLGWFIDDSDKQRTLNHGGAGMAFVSMVALNPDKKVGIVVLANSTYLGRTMGYKLVKNLEQIEW